MTAAMRYQSNKKVRDATHRFKLICDAVKKGDPTGTSDIRRRYKSQIEFRWRKVRALLRQTIIDQDMLGLDSTKMGPLAIAMNAMPGEGKIRAFQMWLDMTLSRVVLEEDTAYLDPMISLAYNRAVVRAMRITANPVQSKDAADVIASIQQLVMVEVQGIDEAVSQAIVRAMSLAQLNKVKPAIAFKAAVAPIEKIGINRSRAMVETYVVKAHGAGTLDQFEAAGKTHVGIVPELIPPKVGRRPMHDATRGFRGTGPGSRISQTEVPSARTIARIRRAQEEVETAENVEIQTAGDDLVCPECEDIEAGGPYTINEARSLIPAHPWCRCSFVPADDARFGPSGSSLLTLLGF